MEAFVNEVIMAYGDWHFLMLSVVLLIMGLIFCKGYRKRFVIPALILTAVILNPLFYSLWYKFNDRSYWRMMWMVPIIPLCVIIPAFFIEKCTKAISKVCILFLSVVLIIICGRFIYDTRGMFSKANNSEKLPDDVVDIGKVVLSLDANPSIVADGNISTYIRQYSGKYYTPYTRAATWGSPSGDAEKYFNYLLSEDMVNLAQLMVNNDYDYLITNNTDEDKREKIENAGFEFIHQVNEYGIYRVHGKKTVIKSYNLDHQVTSVTTVDENGNPVNGVNGYATIISDYNWSGFKDYEYRIDVNGIGVADNFGRAGYISTLDYKGRVIEQWFLGTNGEKLDEGAVKKICEYKNNKMIREAYYDKDCNPINIGESGYASFVNEYDSKGNLSLTFFYDANGKYIECGSSYLHSFLQSQLGKKATIIISVCTEASRSLTETIVGDMKALGLENDLRGKYGYSYCAIISPESCTEELSKEAIQLSGSIDGKPINVVSEGNLVGHHSSIIFDGIEYSKNERGLNIVVIEDGIVTDSISFDTHLSEMKVTK